MKKIKTRLMGCGSLLKRVDNVVSVIAREKHPLNFLYIIFEINLNIKIFLRSFNALMYIEPA